MPNTLSPEIPEGYSSLLSILKERIRQARFRSSLAVNRELILLYWQIGNDILARQDSEGWGAKTIDRLAADLRHDFPEMTGLSPRNLKYMRSFPAAYPDREFVQQVIALLPWGTIFGCSRLSRSIPRGNDTRGKPSSTVGAEMCSPIR